LNNNKNGKKSKENIDFNENTFNLKSEKITVKSEKITVNDNE